MAALAKRYHSKILLFGEYTVMDGSAAIAIPFEKYYGMWSLDGANGNRPGLQKLKQYLARLYYEGKIEHVDFDLFEADLSKGIVFDSTIPTGYGLGSSGALTAAFFDRYMGKPEQFDMGQLKALLSLIESCFHGASSGLDPLVSLLNLPLLIHPDGDIEILDADRTAYLADLRIVDTGGARETAPLVHAYKSTRQQSQTFAEATLQIAEATDLVITAYILDDRKAYTENMRILSTLQLQTLTMLIPQPFVALWQEGLASDTYYMKLCGAGGGGCLLVHVVDEAAATAAFSECKVLSVL